MAEEPSAAVRGLIDAYNARDLDGLMSLFADDVEWHTTAGFLWPGPYRGRAAVRELFEHWWQGWDTGHADVIATDRRGEEEMLSADIHGRSAGDGLDVHVALNWVFQLRGGRIRLVRSYDSADEARAALAQSG